MAEILYKDLSYKVIGTAMEVHKVLGPGFLEAVYQAALANEFELRSICVAELHPKHEAQLINYLAATGFRLGILVNFGSDSLQHKRKVR